ncbi:flavin-containing monooxygenase [Peijinzhouia sedimentorum]
METKICIIGAGPSGITAAKNLLQAGFNNIVIFERNTKVGGNWVYSESSGHSSVFESTHIISSKELSQYEDYPMPADYPDYPSHAQLQAYFESYARHFGVYELIRFGVSVETAELTDSNKWHIETDETLSEYVFDYLFVCNGHHWNPRMPSYPGEFNGTFMHSHDFKNNRGYEGKRVLVIGGGNSACDIAVETGRVSEQTAISLRRGYYFIPKFLMGKPSDMLGSGLDWVPLKLRGIFTKLLLKFSVGDLSKYGLQKPEHGVFEAHPVVNSELLYFIRHGKIHPRVDIDRFDGDYIIFKDGKREKFDTIIAATGYKITFPFFSKNFIDYTEGPVPLYKHIFHPEINNLFFIGLVQPFGCIWPLSDLQSKLAANYLKGNYQLPNNVQAQIDKRIQENTRKFMNTPRHSVQVFYHSYRKELLKEIPANAPEWKFRNEPESV